MKMVKKTKEPTDAFNLFSDIWVPIKGFENLYSINQNGEIKSHARKRPKERVLKPYILPNGYAIVNLGGKNHYVHRLVAQTFIPNPLNKAQVNHKNAIRTDNFVGNLEWATPLENVQHGHLTGSPRNPMKSVKVTNLKTLEKRFFLSQNEASKFLGISRQHISRLLAKGAGFAKCQGFRIESCEREVAQWNKK